MKKFTIEFSSENDAIKFEEILTSIRIAPCGFRTDIIRFFDDKGVMFGEMSPLVFERTYLEHDSGRELKTVSDLLKRIKESCDSTIDIHLKFRLLINKGWYYSELMHLDIEDFEEFYLLEFMSEKENKVNCFDLPIPKKLIEFDFHEGKWYKKFKKTNTTPQEDDRLIK